MGGLIVFDLESVLLEIELLTEVADRIGKREEVERIMKAGLQGELPWEDGFRKRMEILKGTHRDVIREANGKATIAEGARETIRKLKGLGFHVYAVSGGFAITAQAFEDELGLDGHVTNEMVFKDQRLAGWKLNVSDKGEVVRQLKAKLKPDLTITVGDGANDISMFREGVGVAYNGNGIVKKYAKFHINRLDEVVGIASRLIGSGQAHKL